MNPRISLLTFFFFVYSTHVLSNTSWPTPNPDNCDFYTHLEVTMKCSAKGVSYVSEYAPFYCRRFIEKSKDWSPEAQNWTKKTRLCLQESLYDKRNDPNLSCANLEEVAFKTHSICYNDADLCQLKVSELFDIFRIVKIKDYFKELKYSDGGMVRLVKYCLKKQFF